MLAARAAAHHLTEDPDRTPRVHLQLADINTQFDLASARLGRLAAESPPGIWGRRPSPHSWSAAECVAHLNLTSAAYLPILRTALEEARAINEPAPRHFRRTFAGFPLMRVTADALGSFAKRVGTTTEPKRQFNRPSLLSTWLVQSDWIMLGLRFNCFTVS